MKKVEAYIKSHRLNEVVEALHELGGLTGLTTHEIRGFGRIHAEGDEPVRIVDNTVNWQPHVKLEVFCHDGLVDAVVEGILDGAHTGLRADGKIYVSPVDDAVRISTRERGEDAV